MAALVTYPLPRPPFLPSRQQPDIVLPQVPSGIFTGTSSLTATATITAAGRVDTSTGAGLTITANRTATGSATGQAAQTVTATITAAGTAVSGFSGTSSLTVTATVTASGVVATSSGASLTVTAGVTAAGAGIVRAQAPVSNANAGASTTIAATLGSPVTAGGLLVAFAAVDSTGSPSITFSSTGSPTWATIATATESGAVIRYAIGYCQSAPAGTTTITATFSASLTNRSLHIVEYSGAATSSAIDGNTAGGSTAATTTPTDSAIVTTQSGDLIVSALVYRTATTPATVGSGYTLIGNDATVVHWIAEERIQAAAGSIAPTFTVTGGSLASGIMSAAFEPLTAGAFTGTAALTVTATATATGTASGAAVALPEIVLRQRVAC